jgi:pteridine reductase
MQGLLELAGKTALITGGAKRLGAFAALELARHGVHCVIHYRDSEEEACETAAAIEALGVKAWLVQGDLAVSGTPDTVWDRAEEASGGIDFLINSASIFPEATLDELSESTLAPNVNVNTLAPFYLAHRLAATGREGVVINFLDTMVRDYDRKHVPYHLSKKMLHHLTRMMAVEYSPRLRVNGVAPGLVLPPEGKDTSYLESLKHSNLLHAYGSGEQIAHAVIFLLVNTFITGQVIYIDGGRNLRGTMYE